MADKYKNFKDLQKARPETFLVESCEREGDFLFFAPHAGGIEPGTSEICKWFDRDPYSYYIFEGVGKNCLDLHITSVRFDEPTFIQLIGKKKYAISFHGMTDSCAAKMNGDIFVGGLNDELIQITQQELTRSGFQSVTNVEYPNSRQSGKEPQNVSNLCTSKMGMQLEISENLRRRFFVGELKKKLGRYRTTPLFEVFCNTINQSILLYIQQLKANIAYP